LQSVKNVWECCKSEGNEGKQAEWNKECYGSAISMASKLEFNTLHHNKLMKMFKNTRSSVCLVGERDQQRLWQVCFGRAGADSA